MKELILKYSLQNAVRYKGKANVGAVMGKVLAENPKLKENAKKITKEIKKIVDQVNSFTPEQQKKELEKFSGSFKESEQKESSE